LTAFPAADLFDLLTTARVLTGRWTGRDLLGGQGPACPSGDVATTPGRPLQRAESFAGMVTYLVGADRRPWTVANVTPGGPARCAAAYHEPVQLGDVASAHLALCRMGLHVQGATGSADGRLGPVRARRPADGASGNGSGERPIRLPTTIATDQGRADDGR
jgi:hypothetical protein